MNKSKYYMFAVLFLLTAGLLLFTGCSDNDDSKSGKEIVYYCPMHPEVISDKPGVCPICHMDLVLKDQDGDDLAEHLDEGLNLSNSKLVLANVLVVPVKYGEITETVTAYSYLDFAEQSRKSITARFNGRIERLLVDRTGEYVNKGEALFEVYSPDLIQAQNEYLLSGGSKNIQNSLSNMNEAAKQKLLIMGVTLEQLKNLEDSEDVKTTLTYYSPFSGIVIDKKIQEGMYVNEGSAIYEIAELSTLWNIAEVYESDLALIKQGASMELRLDAYPGAIFEGKVDLVYPVVNSQSRTVKIRSVIPNKNGKLKPNMYGEAVFKSKGEKGLLVPESSVLMTGDRNLVWVQKEKGVFESREVKLGRKLNGSYEIISGLTEGELVAESGGFLIDSESQLRSGTSAAHNHPSDLPDEEKKNENENTDEHNNHSSMQESEENKMIKTWNTVCPVIGGKVDPEVKTVRYGGKLIGFCCPGCDEDFVKDPEKYLSNLNENGTIYIN